MWESQHAMRCEELLGKPWSKVHRWLDELAHTTPGMTFNPGHRKHRHNHRGIETIRQRYGDDAAKAAELHILDDFFGPCPHTDAQRAQIPSDEQDYVRKGWH